MRGVITLLALLAAAPAAAAPLTMPEDQPVRFDALPGTQSHLRREIIHQRDDLTTPERNNMTNQLAARLGVEDGTARLFHYTVDSDGDAGHGARLDGGIGGSGLQFKLSW